MENPPKFRVEKNGDGKPLVVELLDDDGKVTSKDAYEYDVLGSVNRRCSFGRDGSLQETESWLRDDAGRLLEHSLRRADNTLVYHEQWHRAADGKLLSAESRAYDAAGKQTAYRKFQADSSGHIIRREGWKTGAIRAVCLLVGGACLLAAMQQGAANFPMAVLLLGIACLNFWNGVKKR